MQVLPENEEDLRGCTIFWRIENFPSKPSDSLDLISPECLIKPLKSTWKIKITNSAKFLKTYLFNDEHSKYYNVTISVALLTGSGWISIVENEKAKFKPNKNTWGVDKLVSLKQLEEDEWFYLPNGSLTLSYRIWNNGIGFKGRSFQYLSISRWVNGDELHHRPVQSFSNLKPSDSLQFPLAYEFDTNPVKSPVDLLTKQLQLQLQTEPRSFDEEDLLKMLKQKKLSFVTLKTSRKDFSVFKSVLCLRSPVFKAILEKISPCNEIEINDVDIETMTSVVKFLHYETVDDLSWEVALKLHEVAARYQIETLKQFSISQLKKKLSNENVCDAIILAERYQNKDFMSCAQVYFCKNSKTILPSKDWKHLLLNHTELAAALLCKLAESM